MSYRLPRYKVSLIREGSCASEHKTIRTPEDVAAIKIFGANAVKMIFEHIII